LEFLQDRDGYAAVDSGARRALRKSSYECLTVFVNWQLTILPVDELDVAADDKVSKNAGDPFSYAWSRSYRGSYEVEITFVRPFLTSLKMRNKYHGT
jgi:hypothetical protein